MTPPESPKGAQQLNKNVNKVTKINLVGVGWGVPKKYLATSGHLVKRYILRKAWLNQGGKRYFGIMAQKALGKGSY